ncbi:hypothetical protein MTE1_5888 [Klebsiella pneumoniae JHCK1]|nr:hypothetical protein MTE1_5888 [Klebsiella pneumoniae JHCK1]
MEHFSELHSQPAIAIRVKMTTFVSYGIRRRCHHDVCIFRTDIELSLSNAHVRAVPRPAAAGLIEGGERWLSLACNGCGIRNDVINQLSQERSVFCAVCRSPFCAVIVIFIAKI